MKIKTLKIDTSGLNRKLNAIATFAPQEPKKILKAQMKLLLEEIIVQSVNPSLDKAKKNVKSTIGSSFSSWKKGAGVIVYKRYLNVRNRNGKVEGKRIPTRAGILSDFLKKQQAKIGQLAAGWLGGNNPLGVRCKSFIKNQKVMGTYKEINTPTITKITVTNKVPYAILAFKKYYPRKVEIAVLRRYRMMSQMLANWQKSGKVRYTLPANLR